MRACEVMTWPVATVRPEDSLAHAAVLMRDHAVFKNGDSRAYMRRLISGAG